MRVVSHGEDDFIIADDKVIAKIEWTHLFDMRIPQPDVEAFKNQIREAINAIA